jgi:hypothetical protein
MPPLEDWDFPRKRDLVEALLDCACMQSPQSRDQIISDLPASISHNIKRFPGGKEDVFSIVNTCANYSGGVELLLQRVEFYEGPSLAWQWVQEVYQANLSNTGSKPAAPDLTAPAPAPQHGNSSGVPPIAPAPPPPSPPANTLEKTSEAPAKTRLILFGALLFAALFLAVVFAGGWLRFGLAGPFIYVLYIFCGMLAAYTCYGLLSSIGELEGKQYGVALKLGGPIVALVVVAGGGGLYEKYGQTPGSFAQRINFYSNQPGQLEKIIGTATLSFGNERRPETLREAGTALYQGIPIQWLGKPLVLDLESTNYEIAPAAQAPLLTDREAIFVKVVRKRQFAQPNEASLELSFREGVALNYVSRPDAKNIVLTLRAVSQTDLAIPIDADATLEILSNSGAPMFNIPLKVTDTTIVPSRGLEMIHLDGFMLKDQYAIALTGKTAVVKLRYDHSVEKSEMEFQTEFTFSKKTVPATR